MSIFKSKNKPENITLDQIVDTYYEPVYWHVRRLVVCHDDACDVCQETFLRAVQAFDSLRDMAAARSWLYRIATNEAMRLLSKRRLSDEEISQTLADRLAEEPDPPDPDPRLRRFNQALASLTHAQRSVFNLRHYDEMSYREIADIVGGSPDTIRVVYHHAKEKIKNFLLCDTK